MIKLRLIGDVHGMASEYLKLIDGARTTIQLGDFGFDYSCLIDVDPANHKILGGNHDNYTHLPRTKHYLGNFGVFRVKGFYPVFFVRGAASIDKHVRTEGFNWWQDEELSMRQCYDALSQYLLVKPKCVISHDCPDNISKMLWNQVYPSRTGQLLQMMFVEHQPKLWVFGHHHVAFEKHVLGTRFVCLPELGTMDFN